MNAQFNLVPLAFMVTSLLRPGQAISATARPLPISGTERTVAADRYGQPETIKEERSLEENKGQVTTMAGDPAPFVRFRYSAGNTHIFLMGNGIAYQFHRTYLPEGYEEMMAEAGQNPAKQKRSDELRSKVRTETFRMDMLLEGANMKARVTTDDRQGSYTNYYGQGALNVHSYGQVTYHDVYPGIDWIVYTTEKGIKYDFMVHPGADPGQIRLRFKDQEELAVDKTGRLVHGNRMGRFVEDAPVSFQAGRSVATRFILEEDLLQFELGTYDRTQPLTIDPARIWATYYGSGNDDAAYSTAVDGSGNVYLAGQTKSSGSIASGGHQNTIGGNYDAFLVKFDASGVRLWATYYGGGLEDGGYSCAVDGSGNVYLAGYTKSTTAIASGGHQGTLGGDQDAFLVKFNASGVRQWGTYYGGTAYEFGACCTVDGSGNVYLAGSTSSSTAIASGGHQNTYNGNYDAFLVKFDPAGVRQWGTYYGGTNGENGNACAVDGSGNVYLAGQTNSTGSIAASGHQGSFGGGTGDGFLVKFNSSGTQQWGTYYGGAGNDFGHACAADGSGNVYLAGEATSTTAIASGGLQNTKGGGIDAFLVKFNTSGTRQWGTYYGGTASDMGRSCAVDGLGSVFLVGQTASTGGIANGGYQNMLGGGTDAFLVKLTAGGSREWSTYYGGSGAESGLSGAVDTNGNIHFAGYTNSSGAIAASGHQNTFGGVYDGFLAKFTSSSSCPGGNEVVVALNTDANPGQITWELTDAGNVVIASGGPDVSEASQLVVDTVCLGGIPTTTCFGFRLMDSYGDGLINGNWQLRTTDGKVLLGDDFSDGYDSPTTTPAYAGYTEHSFCLPPGPAKVANKSCGIFNYSMNSYVYCSNVAGAGSYQFEFSDPDAGYIRRIAVNTNKVRFNQMNTSPLTPGVKYFVRVRTNDAGPLASAHFGAGCEVAISSTVPCTELIGAPTYGHSCNESRAFNTNNSFIYATPVVGATEYQFRIVNVAAGYDETFIRNTYILQLKWNIGVAPPLVNGTVYNVTVNVKVGATYSGFCGNTCTITIDNGARPDASMEQANGTVTMWPNPVREGQVNLSIDGIRDADQNITVDIQDVYGKQVFAKAFGNSGERFTTILDLPSDIASGVYMVNITVNGKKTVQRLSIMR
ncbi:MAG: SBBP repeat-containing protein [Flavobacteriales bacterium]|nr:SBBP repeat-containing protein [Flavobacteriales bacterium]